MESSTEEKSRDVRNLESDREWHGFLTLDNAEAVAVRLRGLLAGQRYTFVTCNEGLRNGFPEIRTGQRLREGVRCSPYAEGHVSVHVADTYGSWGVHSSTPDQAAACARQDEAWKRATPEQQARDTWHDKNLAYLHFRHDRLEMEHFAPAGYRLYWVAVIEYPEDGDG